MWVSQLSDKNDGTLWQLGKTAIYCEVAELEDAADCNSLVKTMQVQILPSQPYLPMLELVDNVDSKSIAVRRPGSSPGGETNAGIAQLAEQVFCKH